MSFTPNALFRNYLKIQGPIDFAYAIHTQVEYANRCYVNGRKGPWLPNPKTGDVVEIGTNATILLVLVASGLRWQAPLSLKTIQGQK